MKPFPAPHVPRKTSATATAAVALAACTLFTACTFFTACTLGTSIATPNPPATDTTRPVVSDPPPAASPDTPTNTTHDACDREIASLKDTILALREEQYIDEARINALEAALEAALADNGGHTTPPDDIPTGVTPETAPTTDTTLPPTDTSTPPSTTETTPSDITPPPTAADADFRYEVRSGANGHATETVILSYSGTARSLSIPASLGGHPVRAIADNAFAGTGVRAVVLPDTIREVGWFAFYGCTALESVVLPASVTTIGYGAFDVCPALTIHCPQDSYAAAYAESFGYRCLLSP